MLRKLIADHQPEYIAASFDLAGPDVPRSTCATDYKANRAPMPADLAEQIPLGARGVRGARRADPHLRGLRSRRRDRHAGRAGGRPQGFDVAIVTGDKDFFQLVGDDGIRVFNPRDEGTWFDADGVKEKFGVAPEQVVDVLALMGDTIDNIKGVPGIGEKGARELIVDARLARRAARACAPSSRSKKLSRGAARRTRTSARESRELLRIRTDVPLSTFDSRRCATGAPTRAALLRAVLELGFRTLVTEYAPTADTVDSDYAVVITRTALTALDRRAARRAGRFALQRDRRLALAACARRSSAWRSRPRRATRALPARSGTRRSTSRRRLNRERGAGGPEAGPRGPGVAKIGHDLKFDLIVLARHGVALDGARVRHDARQLSARRHASSHALEELALEHLGYKALTRRRRLRQGRRRRLPLAARARRRAARLRGRARRSGRAARRQARARGSREDGSTRLFRDLELPLVPVLADIERAGVRIDLPALAASRTRIDSELASRSAQDLRARRRRVQHQLAEAAVGDPVRQAAAAGREADGQDARRRRPPSTCSRIWR